MVKDAAFRMSRPDYTTKRGNTLDVAIQLPGADFTDATIWATLKQKLDDALDDDAGVWKKNFVCNDPDVCDDPTEGIAYIRITGDPDAPEGSTYDLKPKKRCYLSAQVNFADGRIEEVQSVIYVE